MGKPIPLSSTSQLLTQLNKADFLGPLQGASTPPLLTVPMLDPQASVQQCGDLWRFAFKFGSRVNQAAVIFVAAALLTSLLQEHTPVIRTKLSKLLYFLANKLEVKPRKFIDVPFINIKLWCIAHKHIISINLTHNTPGLESSGRFTESSRWSLASSMTPAQFWLFSWVSIESTKWGAGESWSPGKSLTWSSVYPNCSVPYVIIWPTEFKDLYRITQHFDKENLIISSVFLMGSLATLACLRSLLLQWFSLIQNPVHV